ncbi:MAG: hypothetical protein RIB84_22200 [Sneathiellaceae bacterium]
MMRALTRYLRIGWNLLLFATGAREYHWALSPLQQSVNYVASLASRQRDKPYWQRVAVYCYGLLKFRENHYFDGMNFVARLRGPLTQAGLRNFILWQERMVRNQQLPPGFKFNAAILVQDGEDMQTDRLFSALCLSDTVNGFSLFWDKAEAERAFAVPLGLTDAESRRMRAGEGIFDLGLALPQAAPGPAARAGHPAPPGADAGRVMADADLLAAEHDGVPRAFHPSLDPRRQVTHFIKIAHPRGYRLAVSLPESADGFADESLAAWLPHLQVLADREESLTICLLNRFVQGADGVSKLPRGIHAIRQAGLTEQDVLAFAMEAEGFFGCLDIYGLAARSAGRPGIYVPLAEPGPEPAYGMRPGHAGAARPGSSGTPARARTRARRPEIVAPDPEAPEMFAALRRWWRDAEAAGLARQMHRGIAVLPSDDGNPQRNAAGLAESQSSTDTGQPVGAAPREGDGRGGLRLPASDGVGTREGAVQSVNRSAVGKGPA